MVTRSIFIKNQLKEVGKVLGKGIMFMPKNGICWNCGGDIINKERKKGNDGSIMITGCPYCHQSYCE